MVISKRERLINALYSDIKVSSNIRRGGRAEASRNPESIYISSAELLQSLFPLVTHRESVDFTKEEGGYRYKDIFATAKEGVLQQIVAPHYEKLKDLQAKRNADIIRRHKAALTRFQGKDIAQLGRNKKNTLVRQILDLHEKISKY